ncbi:adenylate cyclase [Pseudanabaena sp. lw0831]|uniref:adenylate/guanylate cyclase domain-containing protein n=1 Tax=Pseudanabaena sp. lw0831 TaxID=1357935 RepID=UPI0019155B66|nr:adenylate/guanylate cyclase domain-containing protein [Pseudanabaena sp. lw0831]GBO52198.1 adenylate cyclase [Pseudanabaena sp. lw0831]
MEERSQALLSLAKAKLSRRIAFWIFVSIVVIEAILLVPSYFRREQELIDQVENVSSIQARFFLQTSKSMQTEAEFTDLAKSIKRETNVAGWTVENAKGQHLTQMGEVPNLTSADVRDQPIARFRSANGNRYDVAWNGKQLGSEYVLIIRHNVEFIKQELVNYVWRIIGLVAIISLFVTASTLVILGAIVILPILKLREDLELVTDSISQDQMNLQFHSMLTLRTDEVGDVMTAFNQMYVRIIKEISERKRAEALIQQEKDTSETLLLNILPYAIADRLKLGEKIIADGFSEATVLFADIVSFTELSAKVPPVKLVCLLNEIFSEFDGLAEKYGLEKIKTIGDAYMVVGGLPMFRTDHAEAIADMALEMQNLIGKFTSDLGEPFKIRVGINTGPVVAGVIGIKKFIYDLWGDAVNVASRMESHGMPDHIQVSDSTYAILKNKYNFTNRGKIMIKGKGEMQTYFLINKLKN